MRALAWPMIVIGALVGLVVTWSAADDREPAKREAGAKAGSGSGSAATNRAKPKGFAVVHVRGKVTAYKAAMKRLFGLEFVGKWGVDLLALETDDGRLLPLLPTDGARFFYHDRRMLGRPVLLTARRHDRTPGLQVIDIHSIKDDKVHEIYYWCDVCAIKMYQLQQCDCCQGPIEVREHPVGERFRITEAP